MDIHYGGYKKMECCTWVEGYISPYFCGLHKSKSMLLSYWTQIVKNKKYTYDNDKWWGPNKVWGSRKI